MAFVWSSFSKLTQCLKKCFNSNQTSRNFAFINGPVRYCNFSRKPLLVTSSICGVLGKNGRGTDTDTAEEVAHNVAMATIALKDGNIEKSEEMLLKTLDLAEACNLPLGVISACDMLSSLAMKLGDYEKAEDLLLKALDSLLTQGAPEDDDFVVSFNLKLSRIYNSNGNYDLAELGFKNCLQVQKKKLKSCVDDEAFLLWTTILYWYGKFLIGRERFQEAKSCFQDCYLTSLKLDKVVPKQKMVILYNLGEACQSLGEHDEALKHFLDGIAIDKKCKNPDLTYFYSKLGSICMFKGMYKEAKGWCDQAQKFAIKYRNSDAEKESNECLEKLNNFFVS